MTIEKLITEYTKKAELFSQEITDYTERIRKVRNGEPDYLERTELAAERRLADHKRQQIIQFIADLESLN